MQLSLRFDDVILVMKVKKNHAILRVNLRKRFRKRFKLPETFPKTNFIY